MTKNGLSKEEFKEFIELHEIIEVVECFNGRDMIRREELGARLSDGQQEKLRRIESKWGISEED